MQQDDLFDHGRVRRARKVRPRIDREAFAAAVVKHLGNRTKAAVEVGFSARTAYSAGSRLMRNPGVCRMVAAKAKKIVEDLDSSPERILKELMRIAYFDKRTIYAKDGSLLPIHQWPDAAAAAVAGLETEEIAAGKKRPAATVRKVKIADKVRALELLGKYRKLFTDLSETKVSVTLEELVVGE